MTTMQRGVFAVELARLPRLGETLENAIRKDFPIKQLAPSGR